MRGHGACPKSQRRPSCPHSFGLMTAGDFLAIERLCVSGRKSRAVGDRRHAKYVAVGAYFECHTRIHARIVPKFGMLREDIGPDQNLEDVWILFTDGQNMGYIRIRQGGYLDTRIAPPWAQTSGSWELSFGYNIVMPVGIKYVKGEIPISNGWGARCILRSLDLKIPDSTPLLTLL